ncbi:MAG: 3D domain-containing protein [bacterium]
MMDTIRKTLTRPVLVLVVVALLLGFWGRIAFAATTTSSFVNFTPEVTIPGSTFVAGGSTPVTGRTMGEWISAVYVFLSGIMGVIAALMVMWGGIQWLTASGNTSRVSDAKDTIYSAIIALLLTFGAYLLLFTINPELVKLRDLSDLLSPLPRIVQPTAGPMVSEALFGNTTLSGEKNKANAQGCPTMEEMRDGFEVFLTGYYRPALPLNADLCKPSGGYQNFFCNVGMQCRCNRGVACGVTECQAGGLKWKPCDAIKFDQANYCNSTANSTVPVGLGGTQPLTAAASACFGFGTRFMVGPVSGPATGAVFTSKWVVADRGWDITGRHLDLFMGTGDAARQNALNITGKAKMYVSVYCDNKGNCSDVATQVPGPFPP